MSFLDRAVRRFHLAPHSPVPDEAVIDFLNLVMLADHLSSVDERDRIDTFVVSRTWPDGHNPEAYASESLGAARLVLADPDRLHHALDSIIARLRGTEHRQYALDLADEIAALDGTVSVQERVIIEYIRHGLGTHDTTAE